MYYIEKNVEGYFPVEAKVGPAPVFSVIGRDDNDNKLYKKTFTLIGQKFFLTAKTQMRADLVGAPPSST